MCPKNGLCTINEHEECMKRSCENCKNYEWREELPFYSSDKLEYNLHERCKRFGGKLPSCKLCNCFEEKMNKVVVNIPDGYVIDEEKSNLKEGIIEFKKVILTSWNDINKWYHKKLGYSDNIHDLANRFYEGNSKAGGYTTEHNYIVSYCKLLIIAQYLNGDWKPNGCRYIILSDKSIIRDGLRYSTAGAVYFKDKESAEEAIRIMGDDLNYLFL